MRVLVASRGIVARHLIEVLSQEEDTETVSVFSEPDVEQPWVEEATFSTYLNGATVESTYLDVTRVVSAALDAGCDAVHPGVGLVAERLDFHSLARGANLPVIGTDPRVLLRSLDRGDLDKIAREANIPMIPSSGDLGEADEGIEAAGRLGYPLWVKASAGGVAIRVDSAAELATALPRARDRARALAGDRRLYLQQHVEGLRTVATVVVGDRKGELVQLGHYTDALQVDGRFWIAEMGPSILPPGLGERLGQWALTVAKAVDWWNIGRVRWAISPAGHAFFLGHSPCLPPTWALVEEMLGVDLVVTQLRIARGERLAWEHHDIALDRHGVLLRLLHVDPIDGSRPEGTVERLVLPVVRQGGSGLRVEAAVAEGSVCSADTDPVLAEIVVTAPTRQAALVRARAAVEAITVEGVPTSRDALLRLMAEEAFWKGEGDSRTIPRLLSTFEA